MTWPLFFCLVRSRAKTSINRLDTSRHARHGPVDTSVRPRGDDQQQTRSLRSRQCRSPNCLYKRICSKKRRYAWS
ncbi:hypothetical protein GGI42DRAFT_173238 [Trichoderma sp. SZMC 28013]